MNDMIKKKIDLFYESQLMVHIVCFNGRYYNGVVNQMFDKKEFFIFLDNKLGKIPILFEEVKFIEPKKEVNI